MRKIPPGAEAATVLVGEADFLEQPAMAFVRLVKGIILPGVVEVKILSSLLMLWLSCYLLLI